MGDNTDIDIFKILTTKIDKSKVFCNEPMKKHTSFKVGGNADFYVNTSTLDEIKFILEISTKYNIDLTVVGNGTNLLVKDNGIRGIVLRPNLQNIEIDDFKVKVGSGVSLTYISKLVSNYGLSGLEFAYGIPGTVGGAVRMNAGAYGGEMKDVVVETTYITKNGDLHTITEHEFDYRKSIFSTMNDVIILECVLNLKYGNKDEIIDKMNQNMSSRREKQPLDMPNAGSVFKRGSDFVTAQLIDEAGLKGYGIGGAEVSTKHAGFIVNKGNATADDILKLIQIIQEKIKEKYGKTIELEIIVIGE